MHRSWPLLSIDPMTENEVREYVDLLANDSSKINKEAVLAHLLDNPSLCLPLPARLVAVTSMLECVAQMWHHDVDDADDSNDGAANDDDDDDDDDDDNDDDDSNDGVDDDIILPAQTLQRFCPPVAL